MEAKVTNRGNFERVVEVAVPEQELAPHFDEVYRKYRRNVKLEGFRKGKVPLNLIKKLYGDVIKNEAIDEVVQSVFREVRQKEDLRPVAPAKLEDISYDESEGLKFKAIVEVVPDVEVKTHKGLSAENEIYQVDEEDIENALADVRDKMAVMEIVDGVAEEDHFIVADFQQVDFGGLPIIGKKYEDRFIQLLRDEQNKEVTEQLLGVSAGDKRRIEMHPGEANGDQNQPEFFEVSVKEVKSKQMPELDDEFAKDVGEFENLQALRDDIRKNLIKQTEGNARRVMRRMLVDEFLKKNPLDLPESMITSYLDSIVAEARRDSDKEFDEETLRNEYRASAIRTIKWELLKDKLIEQEALAASDEDKDLYLEKLSKERDVDIKVVRKAFKGKDGQRRVEDTILEKKVIDLIETHAKIKERKITRKDLEKRKRVAI